MLEAPRAQLRRAARVIRAFGGAAVTVTWTRLRKGPLEPAWSWPYEVVMAAMRASFHKPATSLATTRERMNALGRRGRRRPGVRWQRVEIAGVPCEWVEPATPTTGVLVYLHGGGFAFGSTDSHAGLIAEFALTCGRRVLSVEYRLAPEHPCPAALEDVLAVWRAVGGPTTALAGDSAGGALALSAAVAMRDRGLPAPDRLVLLSPWADLAVTGDSVDRYAYVDYLGTRASLRAFARHYLGDRPPTDPEASPLYAELHGLPPTLVLAGGSEVLLDDSIRVAERAKAAGVDLTLHIEPGEVHVYLTFGQLTPRASAAFQQIRAFLHPKT
jgi:monoterpene epsilon-lactone hydrolase